MREPSDKHPQTRPTDELIPRALHLHSSPSSHPIASQDSRIPQPKLYRTDLRPYHTRFDFKRYIAGCIRFLFPSACILHSRRVGWESSIRSTRCFDLFSASCHQAGNGSGGHADSARAPPGRAVTVDGIRESGLLGPTQPSTSACPACSIRLV